MNSSIETTPIIADSHRHTNTHTHTRIHSGKHLLCVSATNRRLVVDIASLCHSLIKWMTHKLTNNTAELHKIRSNYWFFSLSLLLLQRRRSMYVWVCVQRNNWICSSSSFASFEPSRLPSHSIVTYWFSSHPYQSRNLCSDEYSIHFHSSPTLPSQIDCCCFWWWCLDQTHISHSHTNGLCWFSLEFIAKALIFLFHRVCVYILLYLF